MAILSPKFQTTPQGTPSYNSSLADTFSWVPVENDASRPLYARSVYVVNSPEPYTKCQTIASGYPSFTSRQILIYNPANSDVDVTLTLIGGLSCLVPLGKNSEQNHIVSLNVAVSAVNDYNGCRITFFA